MAERAIYCGPSSCGFSRRPHARDLYCDPYVGNNYRPKAKHSAANEAPAEARRQKRPCVNRLYYRDAGGEKRPAFYNIDEIYPSLRELDRNYSFIREEVDSVLLQRDKLPRYHDLTERERYISGTVDADKD
jgi:hypothetical protein